MRLIIKSTWLPDHLHDHELAVLRWIEQHRQKMKYKPNPEPNIPLPVGHVLGLTEAGTQIQAWKTNNGNLRNSTIASFCVPAKPMRKDISLKDLFLIAKGLCRTLDFLSRLGIHYRDLNLGNILRAITEDDGDRNLCVLIDFGNARILKSRRGQPGDIDTPPEPRDVNRDDARSANAYFMSLRVHEMSLKQEEYKAAHAGLESKETLFHLDYAEETDEKHKTYLLEEFQGVKDHVRGLHVALGDAAYQHRYVDDLESAVYLFLYHVSPVQTCVFHAVPLLNDLSHRGILIPEGLSSPKTCDLLQPSI